MIGKQSDNYFTPLQKLSDVASAIQGIRNSDSKPCSSNDENKLNTTMTDLQNHPTFGFKAGLIRIIGNMCYRNKECQDLVSIKFLFPNDISNKIFVKIPTVGNIIYHRRGISFLESSASQFHTEVTATISCIKE